MVDKKRTNLLVSLYLAFLSSRKGNIKFFEVALLAVYCNYLIDYIMIVWRYRPWNIANTQQMFIYLSKTDIQTLKQNVKFV